MREFKKIFGIGLSRTGTSSLNEALNILGIPSHHYPPVPRLDEYANKYRGLTDTPVAAYFKSLDRTYPGSLFIITVRDRESWTTSAARHFTRPWRGKPWQRELRHQLFGSSDWDIQKWPDALQRHRDMVYEYFDNRGADFLELNIVAGDGWGKLCNFLCTPTLSIPFPHTNQYCLQSINTNRTAKSKSHS
jgi:hypothetical protein